MVDREAEAHELAMKWMKLVDPAAADRMDVLLQDFDFCTPGAFKQFDVIYLGVSIYPMNEPSLCYYCRQALEATNSVKPTFHPKSFLSYAKMHG